MKRMMLSVAFLGFILLMHTGCATTNEEPAKESVKEPVVSGGPPSTLTDSQIVASGKEIFNKNCSRCHPGGGAGIGPTLKKKSLAQLHLQLKVRHGSGTMPRFSQTNISDEQLDAVVAYIATLREQ